MASERRINLRFTPEHFDKIDVKRFGLRTSFQDLGVRLFDNWLSSDGELALHSSLRKPADPLIEQLAVLQARGDKGLLALAEKAIELAYSVLQKSVSAEELEHLKAVAYGDAKPSPKPSPDATPRRRGRPRKIA